jgi:ABC-type branched-subunit amino acid transport system permease subunit
MSTAVQFYATTILVYAGVSIMACLGLNLQFGVSGIINFAFIAFQAVGAYTAAALALGPAPSGGFQQYIGFGPLPFPLPILIAGVVGGLFALLVGVVCLRRLRADYQAMVMLAVSLIATTIATNTNLVGGAAGLSTVPKPLYNQLGLPLLSYQWFYVGLTLAITLIVYFFVHRMTSSPMGRALRAMRDNEHAASALGKNVQVLRLLAFVAGGVIAAVSGAVLVLFISAWAPSGWLYPETFVYFTAIIVGGSGRNLGAVAGAILVPVLFLEGARFLPVVVNATFIDGMQWVAIGLVSLVFLWFRPKGIFPEKKQLLDSPRRTRWTGKDVDLLERQG